MKSPLVTQVDIYPPAAVLEGTGTKQQYIARAHYSDGTDRDVTTLAAFTSNDDSSGPVAKDGLVSAVNRGEAYVTARFDTITVGSQVLVLPLDMPYTAPPSEGNYVDQLVGEKLKKLRILPSEICTDEEFLRRATIDITGQLPTEAEYVAFMSDPSPKSGPAWSIACWTARSSPRSGP